MAIKCITTAMAKTGSFSGFALMFCLESERTYLHFNANIHKAIFKLCILIRSKERSRFGRQTNMDYSCWLVSLNLIFI